MIDGSQFSDIYEYCDRMSDIDNEVLYDLYRETHLKTLAPRMASGPVQGRFLSLLSKLFKPKSVLEIGTFTGYATICLAEGLAQGGHIDTIEINPELNYLSDKYFRKLGFRGAITSYTGNALEIIPTLDKAYDLIFIDAKKRDYTRYYDMVIDKILPGGLILADNVLWDGKVVDDSKDMTTLALREFNAKVKVDKRVRSLLLPLRDGVMILERI